MLLCNNVKTTSSYMSYIYIFVICYYMTMQNHASYVMEAHYFYIKILLMAPCQNNCTISKYNLRT